MISARSELKDRIEARQKELQAKLLDLKADTKGAWREQITNIEQEMANVKELIKNGWDNMTDAIADKLNDWLKKNKGL